MFMSKNSKIAYNIKIFSARLHQNVDICKINLAIINIKKYQIKLIRYLLNDKPKKYLSIENKL